MISCAQLRPRVRGVADVDFSRHVKRTSLNPTGTTPKKKKTTNSNSEQLAASVEKLTVDEPRVKSKNLNVIEEYEKSGLKRAANFVVVGMFKQPGFHQQFAQELQWTNVPFSKTYI